MYTITTSQLYGAYGFGVKSMPVWFGSEPWKLFESLKLLYQYEEVHKKIIRKFGQEKKRDIQKYKEKTKDPPYVIHEKNLKKLATQNTVFLMNAHELWQEAQSLTDRVKPIIFYYSWQQFSAFFIYTLLKWSSSSKGHGVSCDFKDADPLNISEIQIEFYDKGFFRRLIDTLVLLGRPTAYAAWIPLQEDKGLNFEKNTFQSKISSQAGLSDILDFNPEDFYREFKSMYPEKVYDKYVDVLLTDYLLAFLSSNIARYKPQLWANVLLGKGRMEAELNLRVKDAYEHFGYAGVKMVEGTPAPPCFIYEVWAVFRKWSE